MRLFGRSQKGNSQKLGCRMPHSPARRPPYGRPETSRLLKVDHYTLHLRIKMRSCGCAASSQKADADRGARVSGVHWGGLLPEVRPAWHGCMQKPFVELGSARQPLWPSRSCSSATKAFKPALRDSETCGSGLIEESGTLQQTAQRREAMPRCPLQSIPFLSQTP